MLKVIAQNTSGTRQVEWDTGTEAAMALDMPLNTLYMRIKPQGPFTYNDRPVKFDGDEWFIDYLYDERQARIDREARRRREEKAGKAALSLPGVRS